MSAQRATNTGIVYPATYRWRAPGELKRNKVVIYRQGHRARCEVLGPAEKRQMGHIKVWVHPCHLDLPGIEPGHVSWLEPRTLDLPKSCSIKCAEAAVWSEHCRPFDACDECGEVCL